MAIVRYAVRRAKSPSDKRNGKRWVAQAEFPGGRAIKLAHTRNRPPAIQVIHQEVRGDTSAAINAGAIPAPTGNASVSAGASSSHVYERSSLLRDKLADYSLE